MSEQVPELSQAERNAKNMGNLVRDIESRRKGRKKGKLPPTRIAVVPSSTSRILANGRELDETALETGLNNVRKTSVYSVPTELAGVIRSQSNEGRPERSTLERDDAGFYHIIEGRKVYDKK